MPVEKLSAKKPVSILYRELNINPKNIFIHLAKASFSAVFLDGKGVQNNLLDLIKDMGLKSDKEQVAYRLILNAFSRALTDIIGEFSDLFDEHQVEQKVEEAAIQFEEAVATLTIEIDADFFERPAEVGFLTDIESAICFWLQTSGIESAVAKSIYTRVKERFVLSLHHEWLTSPADYSILEDEFDSPFKQARQKQIAWQHYNNWLIEQTKARLFEESFGLDKVYVPLRAYYEIKEQISDKDTELSAEQTTTRHVLQLHEEMHQWLGNFSSENAVRIITGGPGSGKSTFAKMFAAEVVQQHPRIKVIFVPLQYFAIEADLVTAMENFVKQEPFLEGSPLHNSAGEKRLLIIFDGLDELSAQGKLAEQSARDFIDEVIKKTGYANQRGMQRQALVTSRDITAQSCSSRFRQQGQYLQVLPYFIDSENAKKMIDEQNLLSEDQRQLWWQQYGTAKGKGYPGLPEKLTLESLEPITTEPLLNYLVALSYEREAIDFEQGTTLNVIYEDLLQAVFDRKYADGEHDSVKNLSFDKFTMVLEAIAIAVWHGHGRTASEKSIADYCEQRGLSEYLEEYQQGNKKGLNRLLTAFYFRESDKGEQEHKTFEFTHKSFGEYLTARCIFTELQSHHTQFNRHKENPRDGKNIFVILCEWAELCGPTAIDHYLASFIRNEAQKRTQPELEALQQTLAYFLSHAINHSLPMEKTGLSDFKQMLRQTRNAEEALMVMHYACAAVTLRTSNLTLNSGTSFGSWLRRIQPQRNSPFNEMVLDTLGYLNLYNPVFDISDLYKANLKGAKLEKAKFFRANLQGANLQDANLQDASLRSADLRYAELRGANLEGANLEGANLEGANLRGANLRDANLEGAKLNNTILEGANLEQLTRRH